jgi:TPP-dependent pyruvate/acetoin dehydrogenase alpha subunit
VATQLPHAVGLAYGIQYRGEDSVVMVYFGDGATSEGDFHEAANFAGAWHGPVVFVCQNNQWAISVPLKKQTNSRTIAQKATAYGFPGIQVDGNDVLAVYAASREAVDRARAGDADADRMCHLCWACTPPPNDPTKYRSEEEVKAWGRRIHSRASAPTEEEAVDASVDEQVDEKSPME